MQYDLTPSYPLPAGQLTAGFESLAQRLSSGGVKLWLIDGVSGVDWAALRAGLRSAFEGHDVAFFDVGGARLEAEAVGRLLADGSASAAPGFGRLYSGELRDFLDPDELGAVREGVRQASADGRLVVCFGQGSSLLSLDAAVAWVDVPKEILGRLANADRDVFLAAPPYPPAASLACVDGPLVERHRAALLPALELFVDLSDPALPVLVDGAALRTAVADLSRRPFRPKPSLYSAPWGGQWLRREWRLDDERPDCAGSHELVASENGVLFHDRGLRLEVPFESFLALEAEALLGRELSVRCASEFPIRFNFTDTVGGGHLSCQVHPTPEYALHRLGHRFVEHETYYIAHAEAEAAIHLGLRDGRDPVSLRRAAERARDEAVPFDTLNHVAAWPAHAGDVFHIPPGTVHNIGAGNLVLEIIASPEVHTFRIYDYLRRDSAGRLRPVHIEAAWEVLDLSRTTGWVRRHLLPSPRLVRGGEGWTEVAFDSIPGAPYAVHRVAFEASYPDATNGTRFHLLNLVEGDEAVVEWAQGSHALHRLETILIPAATGEYLVHNRAPSECKVVKAFAA